MNAESCVRNTFGRRYGRMRWLSPRKTAWAAALSGLLFFLCGLEGSAVSQPIGECTACRRDRNSPTGFSQRCRQAGQISIVPCDPPEQQPPPGQPTMPIPGDLDRDRLVDSYEQHLLLKFAPKIWLHPDETRLPVNVRWLLARSTLRFSHVRCSDHGLLAFGQVTVANLSQQTHRNANDPLRNWPWNACDHSGPTLRSDSYVSGPRTSFFLQFRDSAHNGSARIAEWELYAHVFQTNNNKIMIQYWQLYAFNDSFASANHEGDWEYTGVLINAAEVVQRVVHFRHGRIVESAPSRVEWDGTHHVTYVARGGHAQYRGFVRDEDCVCEGRADCAQGFADNCKPGIAWISWDPRFGGIVNVGEKNAPLNNSGWLRFSGIWGEVGAAAGVVRFTSGPQGPAFQDAKWRWPN